MSYSTTYKSPSLDETTKPRDRNLARIGAALVIALILLMIFWRFFSKLDPKPEAGGIMASFGNVAIAGSGSAENDSENTKSNPTPPVETKVEKVETNDDIKSESIKTEKTPQNNTKANPTEPKEKADDGPKGLNFGEFKGNGEDKGNGQLGTPDGKNPLPVYGSGKGKQGDGVEEGNSGRDCRENCTSCTVGGTWDEVGDAFVVVEVTPSGKVISSRLADVKKYPQNAQFFGRQKIIAENCAMQRVYDSNNTATKNLYIVVKISFKKG